MELEPVFCGKGPLLYFWQLLDFVFSGLSGCFRIGRVFEVEEGTEVGGQGFLALRRAFCRREIE